MSRLRQGLVASLLSFSLGSLSGCNEARVPAPAASSNSPDGESPEHNAATVSKPDDAANDSVKPAAGNESPSDVVLISNDQTKSETKKTIDKPLFDGWGKPAFTLVLSGEQHGYFEPCGCAENQSGGVSRRHDLIKQIQAKGWPLTCFDLGGMVNRNRPQTKLKFQTFLAAMKDMPARICTGPDRLPVNETIICVPVAESACGPLGMFV